MESGWGGAMTLSLALLVHRPRVIHMLHKLINHSMERKQTHAAQREVTFGCRE